MPNISTSLKRYLVFAGNIYCPAGGWVDLKRQDDSAQSAVAWAEGYTTDDDTKWAHVVCLENGAVIWTRTFPEKEPPPA